MLLSEAKLDVTICADSAGTIGDLIGDMTKDDPSSKQSAKTTSLNQATSQSIDLLG